MPVLQSPRRKPPWLAIAFLGPTILLLAGFLVYPIVFSVIRSLYDKTGDGFVGLGNYKELFTDPTTFTALKNNLIWVIVAPSLVTMFGLFFADAGSKPLTVYLGGQTRQFGSSLDVLSSGSFLSLIVPLMVFFALQRFFVQGMMAGSVK